MRQKYFQTPFAASGDRASPPNATQPDGSVSYTAGFGPDYEADPSSDPNAKPVPREETNGLFHDLSDAVAAIQREGVPEFITSTDNGGTAFAYSRGALVRWSATGNPPFTTYVSLVNSNTAIPSVVANWQPLLFEAATNAQAIDGTSTSLIVTPAALKAAMQVASVTVPDATTSVKGIQRNATNAEAQAGSLSNVTITASALSSALGAYNFNASQVAAGTLALARLPNLPASQVTSGTFDPARIPAINIAATQVTSGTLPVARGGTGAATFASGSYLRGNGTGAFVARTPAQVLSDIGAASASGQTFSGPVSATTVTSVGSVVADNGVFARGAAGILYLRPSGPGSTTGQVLISSAGAVTAPGGFDTGSSRTIKRDIAVVPYGLAEVEALQPVRFRYAPDYRPDDRPVLGFIAEDVRELIPEPVRDTPDEASPLALQIDQLVPVLWRAVQELSARVRELEAR